MERRGITAANRPFWPQGAAKTALYCRDREYLLDGPAGTGKTVANLNKLLILAEKYAGSRHLIIRKTRASLTESVLITWEEHVVPGAHGCLDGPSRKNRAAYHFANGSTVVLGGMDKATRILSSEYDTIYVPEAIELTEEEWEVLTTRLRHGAMPYQQLLADTNPDKPSHWLNQRCLAGRCTRILSRHEDNPRLFNPLSKSWTPEGVHYIGTLDRLTGTRLQRFRFGRWIAAEGQVYDGWDAAVHLVDRRELPADWPRIWTVDFGYNNPFVWQSWAIDHDGALWLEAEIYHTQRLVEDHAVMIRDWASGRPRPRGIYCDHDAEDRATLERHLRPLVTRAANKAVSTGIQAVSERLRSGTNGQPRLCILRDILIHPRDPELVNAKRPTCTAEEIDGYVWDTKSGLKIGEQPLKLDDHGCDAMRYAVASQDATPSRSIVGF